MAVTEPTVHILRSPENGIVLAHVHDERSFAFIDLLLQEGWPGGEWEPHTWEGQAVFPLTHADHLVQMAKLEGLSVVDGPTCF